MNHKLFLSFLKRNHKILTPARTKLKSRKRKKKMITTCPFCNIISGKIVASVVYEDATTIAFMDTSPTNTGHTLVVPKKHWENIYEIPEEILSEVIIIVKKVSVAVKKTVSAEGISILQLNGRFAGQSVMHFHVHVIPRFKEDSISKAIGAMVGHHGLEKPDRRELDEIAQRVQKNL
jgi:histidine triad (HIT) family protein